MFYVYLYLYLMQFSVISMNFNKKNIISSNFKL